jgi:hypothetical protein
MGYGYGVYIVKGVTKLANIERAVTLKCALMKDVTVTQYWIRGDGVIYDKKPILNIPRSLYAIRCIRFMVLNPKHPYLLLQLLPRLIGLGSASVWFDEGFSILAARLPLGTMLNLLKLDFTPPLWEMIIHPVVGSGRFSYSRWVWHLELIWSVISSNHL